MIDFDPDYGEYLDSLLDEEGLGAYRPEREYSKRPLPGEIGPTGGFNHHPECTSPDGNPYDESCICRSLYERDYHEKEEATAEEMHEEWWT